MVPKTLLLFLPLLLFLLLLFLLCLSSSSSRCFSSSYSPSSSSHPSPARPGADTQKQPRLALGGCGASVARAALGVLLGALGMPGRAAAAMLRATGRNWERFPYQCRSYWERTGSEPGAKSAGRRWPSLVGKDRAVVMQILERSRAGIGGMRQCGILWCRQRHEGNGAMAAASGERGPGIGTGTGNRDRDREFEQEQ